MGKRILRGAKSLYYGAMSRPSSELAVLIEASGQAQAELLRSMLEAHGVEVWLSGEAAGSAIGLSVGRLGRIELLVRQSDLVRAQEIIGQQTDLRRPS